MGETFACTLCANNELPASDDTRRVGGVRMAAEMQTPLNPAGAVLELGGAGGDEKAALERDEPLQRIVRFELKEEGTHILAVTVTYTETQRGGEGQASSGRVRTFRKLYQFVAQTLLSVRTKAGELPSRAGGSRYALEAQLENLGDNAVSLEVCAWIRAYVKSRLSCESQAVSITPKPPFRSISLNWDLHSENSETPHSLILNPRDVTQVAFLLEPRDNGVVEQEGTRRGQVADSRIVLGQLCFQWRSAMGDRGSLKTGWLTSRKR